MCSPVELNTLLNVWFDKRNEKIWFNSTEEDDKSLALMFESYFNSELDINSELELNSELIVKKMSKYDEFRYTLSKIILNDQIQRHISRYKKLEYDEKYLNESLKYSIHILYRFTIEEIIEYSEPKNIPFILLPFRHTKKKYYIEYALCILNMISEKVKSPYIDRFRNQSLKSLSTFNYPEVPEKLTDLKINKIKTILDKDSFDILLTRTIDPNYTEPIVKTLSEQIKKYNFKNITVSISGGKDSMVLITILKLLQLKHGYNLNAIHINYMNRKESLYDEYLVTLYVKEILNIPLYIRRITELKRSRKSKDREFYEKFTKDIRFNSYKYVTNKSEQNCVTLGHNNDDTIENIITNIKNSTNLDNLKGMKDLQKIYNVSIWRPLLNHTKADIESYAKLVRIPFTYDSTPKWSQRGKLRDNVIPELKRFSGDIVQGFVKLSDKISEMDIMYKTYTLPYILSTHVKKYEKVVVIKIPEILSEVLWKDILRSLDIKQPSNKSIKYLCNVLLTSKNLLKKTVKIMLSKDTCGTIKNGNLIIDLN